MAITPAWLAIRRDEFAGLVAAYHHAYRRPRLWGGVVVGIGGLLLALLLAVLSERRHWPEALAPWFFFGGWVVLLLALWVVNRRERQLLAQYQLPCPTCGAPLLGEVGRSGGGRSGVGRAELVITTGHCPACGAHVLAP